MGGEFKYDVIDAFFLLALSGYFNILGPPTKMPALTSLSLFCSSLSPGHFYFLYVSSLNGILLPGFVFFKCDMVMILISRNREK
jgi:hypothetical protein